ncbi:MAG: hypothetical protein ABH983_01470 [Candidatus Micrarchaeota archaeon]
MDVQNKINSLVQYRENLDNEDKQIFDMLVGHAREIAFLQAA